MFHRSFFPGIFSSWIINLCTQCMSLLVLACLGCCSASRLLTGFLSFFPSQSAAVPPFSHLASGTTRTPAAFSILLTVVAPLTHCPTPVRAGRQARISRGWPREPLRRISPPRRSCQHSLTASFRKMKFSESAAVSDSCSARWVRGWASLPLP